MEVCCDLEVDVNGEETFIVDKKILASFSGRFSKLFSGLSGRTSNLKVIFHDFPGGTEGFELIARYCYSPGKTKITASNIVLLSCAASFMEMGYDGHRNLNLIDQIEKSLEEISYWTWPELLVALKQCQVLLPRTDSLFVLEKVVSGLVERIALSPAASHYPSLSDDSTFQFSCDTKGSDSLMNICCQRRWWFEDLMFLNIDFIDKVSKMMITENFEHDLICKFLLHYRKSRFRSASQVEKCKMTEVLINLLSLLDTSSLSCKSLFNIFHVALSLKVSRIYRQKLESLIGSQLDQATLDYLLVPSPRGKDYIYDVSLVLRLVKVFLFENRSWLSMSRFNKVAGLVDSYLAEVSPDSHLKLSKFVALLKVLPDFTRQSHDRLYHAMDMYLQVHAGLCEEEKLRVCSALNYGKLSADALKHLAQNSKFPSRIAVISFINQQSKLKSLHPSAHRVVSFSNSLGAKVYIGEKADAAKVIQYAKKNNITTTTEKFEAQFRGMQWRVTGLEKICSIMQTEMGHMSKRRLPWVDNTRYLPKLCS